MDGKGGAAIALGDPVYLAIADDAAIRTVTGNGVTDTAMPAFAQSSGGALTDRQIGVIVGGIRARWAKPDFLHGANPPPYTAQTGGDPSRGANVYQTYCSSCHGVGGRKWALPIGAATCPASRCRRTMSPMWWHGLRRSGQEEFDDPTAGGFKTRIFDESRASF
jgi:mono/diheme cytochrome c family protein